VECEAIQRLGRQVDWWSTRLRALGSVAWWRISLCWGMNIQASMHNRKKRARARRGTPGGPHAMGAMDGARQGTAPLVLLQCVLLDRGVCPFGLSRPSFRDDMMYIKSKRLRAVRRLQTVLSAVARPPGPRPTSRHHLPCLKAHGRTKLPPNYAATARTRASSGQSTLRTAALTITAPRAQATQTVRYRVRPIARTACMPARVFLGAGFYCAHTPMFENCTETTTRRPIQAGTRVQGYKATRPNPHETLIRHTWTLHCTTAILHTPRHVQLR